METKLRTHTLDNFRIVYPDTRKFRGYMAEQAGGIFISAIESIEQGKGHFSELISELKQKYAFIKVPTPSRRMVMICLHLGFKLETEWFPEPFNEEAELMVWRKAGLD